MKLIDKEDKIFVGELVEKIVSGKNLRCEERPPSLDEKGVVKVSAVTWGKFDPLASKTLPATFEPPEKSRIRNGDLLRVDWTGSSMSFEVTTEAMA